MANILVVRTEKIGDAIIALPILSSLALKYPEDRFYFLTYPRFQDIIDHMPDNVFLIPLLQRDTRSLLRQMIYRVKRYLFFRNLKKNYSFDKIAFLSYSRFERKVLKRFKQVKHVEKFDTSEIFSEKRLKNPKLDNITVSGLYLDVFKKLGYTKAVSSFDSSMFEQKDMRSFFLQNHIREDSQLIALAPFSFADTKEYSVSNMEKVIEHYQNKENIQILIFGGGTREEKIASEWQSKYSFVISLIGKMNMGDEIAIMTHCKVIITMDSANMHIGALTKTPVVSIWGPNAPELGFHPSNLDKDDTVFRSDITCRPCSFWGESVCTHEKYMECLNIHPSQIIDKIDKYLI